MGPWPWMSAEPIPDAQRLVGDGDDQAVPRRRRRRCRLRRAPWRDGPSARSASARRLPIGSSTIDRFGSRLAGERVDGGGDFGAGFGVEPAVEAVLAVERAGNVQLLVGPLLRRPLFRVLRCGGGFHHLSQIGQLARGDVRRRLSQRLLDLGGQRLFQSTIGFADHRRMRQADLAGLPRRSSRRHPIDQRPAELDPFGAPRVRLTRQVPQIRDRRVRPVGGVLAGAINPLQQPARRKLTLAHRRQHLGQRLSGQRAGHLGGDGRGEFGEQRMCLRRLLREPDFDHVFDISREPAAQPPICSRIA